MANSDNALRAVARANGVEREPTAVQVVGVTPPGHFDTASGLAAVRVKRTGDSAGWTVRVPASALASYDAFEAIVRRAAGARPGEDFEILCDLDFDDYDSGPASKSDAYVSPIKLDNRAKAPVPQGVAGFAAGAPTYAILNVDASFNDSSEARVAVRKVGESAVMHLHVPGPRAERSRADFEDALREQLGADAVLLYPKTPTFSYPWGGEYAELPADNAEMAAAVGLVAEARQKVAAEARERLARCDFSEDGGAAALAALEAIRAATEPTPAQERLALRNAVAAGRERAAAAEAERRKGAAERAAWMNLTPLGRALLGR
jgi:hypothetical protein